MESSSYKCPFCDAPLETLHGQLVPTCAYCGKDIPVGQAIRVEKSSNNFTKEFAFEDLFLDDVVFRKNDTPTTEKREATPEELKRHRDREYLYYLRENRGSIDVRSRDVFELRFKALEIIGARLMIPVNDTVPPLHKMKYMKHKCFGVRRRDVRCHIILNKTAFILRGYDERKTGVSTATMRTLPGVVKINPKAARV